jgi:hypothetical protein
MKIKKILTAGVLFSAFVLQVYAISVDPKTVYKNTASIDLPTLKVPTVVELSSKQFGSQVAVFDDTTATFVPSLMRSNAQPIGVKETEIVGLDNSSVKEVVDGNFETFFEFNLPEQGRGSVALTLRYVKPFATNAVSLYLAPSVALPTNVTVKAHINGEMKTIVSNVRPTSSLITFPTYTSDWFLVEFEYGQPLRVNEIIFGKAGSQETNETLRFLALPNHSYKIFSNPVFVVNLNLSESADLHDNRDVLGIAQIPSVTPNPLFKEPDVDSDGVIDTKDNCVQVANPDQKDEDENGRGDTCDDFDRDGVINSSDNCADMPNRTQADTDKDGKGDVCDGEESRLTEKYPSLVWGAILFAVLVFGSLFYFVLKKDGSQVN